MIRTIKNDTYLSRCHLLILIPTKGDGDETKNLIECDFTIILVIYYYGMAYRISN